MAQDLIELEYHNLVRDALRQPKPGPTCLSDIQGVVLNMCFLLVLKDLHQNRLSTLVDIIH